MTQPPSPPDPSVLDKLKQLLPTLIVTGGGGYSLYCLVTDDIPNADFSLYFSGGGSADGLLGRLD
jgi:hypothetical protein